MKYVWSLTVLCFLGNSSLLYAPTPNNNTFSGLAILIKAIEKELQKTARKKRGSSS